MYPLCPSYSGVQYQFVFREKSPSQLENGPRYPRGGRPLSFPGVIGLCSALVFLICSTSTSYAQNKLSSVAGLHYPACGVSCLLPSQSASSVPATQTSVTTWHYDIGRNSANTTEFSLAPSNVNSSQFGKLATFPVDGFVVAQPLYLPQVNVPGLGLHNVVYVATMHDSVYAFDADSTSTTPLWMTSVFTYSPAGATTVPATIKKDAGTTGWVELGIVSTPVIDTSTNTLYLVAETY